DILGGSVMGRRRRACRAARAGDRRGPYILSGTAGFQITDFMGPPVSVYFMPRQHPPSQSRPCPRAGQSYAPSDDGILLSRRCWPELRPAGSRVAVNFGWHPNDLMISFYMRTPSDFPIEPWMGWP